ncbi:hypothetical protein Cgig2_022810 [Carnegiea gigantea]|uniref:RNA-polymerase II-associated protein 3-like C-terminal domain-containing protein n=1 Tax=Carnegiea gigantea TaxID=171969 RepID=A0A9Q1KQN3_9CARY|nr:hypothetical protein Cgig2_022810 [Carnegiea gigantea]
MSKAPSEHGRDQAMGFLNDLQDWELSLKDKKSKPQDSAKGKSKLGLVSEERQSASGTASYSTNSRPSMQYDPLSNIPISFMAEEGTVNATSEKDLVKLITLLMPFFHFLSIIAIHLRSTPDSLCYKAILARAGGSAKKPVPVVKEVTKNVDANRHERSTQSIADRSKKPVVDVLPDDTTVEVSGRKLPGSNNTENKTSDGQNRLQSSDSHEATISHLKNNKSKKELGTSVQELASRAASRALAEAAKNITQPNSAYQFEATWRGFSGDRSLQAHLLKVTAPEALPQIFKNALTARLLLDIIKCISTIFTEDTELAVKYLENLTKVSRFDMIIMCLARADKADLCRIWNEEFLGKATPIEYAEKLSELRPRYCPQ